MQPTHSLNVEKYFIHKYYDASFDGSVVDNTSNRHKMESA